MQVEIDGEEILSEADFHVKIASNLNFPAYYGQNLDALWDVLSCDLERPLLLVWRNSELSKREMPAEFARIVSLLNRVVQEDLKFGWTERFEFRLE